MDRVDETKINYDLIEDTLALMCDDPNAFTTPDHAVIEDGAILIFLPGMGEIRVLMERLMGTRRFGNTSKYEIVPMHSSLSSREQRRAFQTPRKGLRKIIISTNIAETSVTIPDVTCGTLSSGSSHSFEVQTNTHSLIFIVK